MRATRIFALMLALLMPATAFAAAASPGAKEKGNLVRLETSLGDIVIELNSEKAPNTVANFKKYVTSGFYDNTIFHRVIKNFMIQGGGLTQDMKTKPTKAPIQNEANNNLRNVKYSVAMARTGDPHSATAQFFINVKDNPFLDHKAPSGNDWGYAVFGKVIQGTEVVDRIVMVKTGSRGGHQDVPVEPVFIVKAVILQ